jgi:ABC-type molybdate transport system substrate-binding protein
VIARAATLLALLLALPAMAQTSAKILAAGSLRAALTQAATAFKAQGGGDVAFEFGPSGLLRDRLAHGGQADVFASANMEHPRSLVQLGMAKDAQPFARNRMCALARERTGITTKNVLERMLHPAVKLGTSTPRADPSGDYAWEIFRRAEIVRPGAFETLSHKAMTLVGGPETPEPPPGRTLYTMLMSEGKADIFLTYCTNTRAAAREDASLASIDLPEELAVGAEYGLAVLNEARPAGHAFAQFLLGAGGQRVLADAGFDLPAGR